MRDTRAARTRSSGLTYVSYLTDRVLVNVVIRVDPDNVEHPIFAVANNPGTAAEAKGKNPQVSGEIAGDTNPDTLALDRLGSESLARSEDDLGPGQLAELLQPDSEVTAVAGLAVRDPEAILEVVEAEEWSLIVS